MADDIDVANDLFTISKMKPGASEEINAFWGRQAMANVGELARHLMYDPVSVVDCNYETHSTNTFINLFGGVGVTVGTNAALGQFICFGSRNKISGYITTYGAQVGTGTIKFGANVGSITWKSSGSRLQLGTVTLDGTFNKMVFATITSIDLSSIGTIQGGIFSISLHIFGSP